MAKTLYRYVSNGIRTVYPVSFALGYLERDDIYVYQGEHIQFEENNVNFIWRGDFEIELERPFAVGEVFYIRRVVDRDKAINDYEEGAILRETNLDDSFAQSLMILEELADGFFDPYGNEGFVDGASGGNTPVTPDDVYTKDEVDRYLDNIQDTIRNELDNIETIIDNLDGDLGDFSDLIDDINELRNSTLDEAQAYLTEITDIFKDINGRVEIRNNEMEQEAVSVSLKASIDNVSEATLQAIQLVQADVEGNAKAIDTVVGRVENVENETTASFTRLQQAEVDIEGNAESITILQNTATSQGGQISANTSNIQTAQATADGAANAVTLLNNTVTNLSEDVSANSSLLLSSGLTEDGDTNALLSVKADVYDVDEGLAATFDLAGEAKTTAEGAAQAVGGISARVDTVEDFAQAQVTLNAGYNDSLDTLYARAFFGTNINGQVTGIYVGGDENLQQILFKADAVGFLDSTDTLMIYYNLQKQRYVFDGDIVASGIFTGELNAATGTFSGDLDAAGGTFSGDLSAAGGTFSGTLDGVDGNFSGTLYAQNIEGDITELDVITRSSSITVPDDGSEVDILEFTVNGQPFDRKLVITVRTSGSHNASSSEIASPPVIGVRLYKNGTLVNSTTQQRSEVQNDILFPNTRNKAHDITMYVDLPQAVGSNTYKLTANTFSYDPSVKSASVPSGINNIALVKVGSTVTNVNTF